MSSYFREDKTNFQGAQRFYGDYAKAEFWMSAMADKFGTSKRMRNINVNTCFKPSLFKMRERLSSAAGGGDDVFFAMLFPKFLYFSFYIRFLVKLAAKPMLLT